jgi:hypothetical protein
VRYGELAVQQIAAREVASTEQARSRTLYSYDTDFNRFPGINRQEP